MTKRETIPVLIIVTLIAVLDGALKYFAIQMLPAEHTAELSRILAFVLHKNPGITFDIEVPFLLLAPITVVLILFMSMKAYSIYATQPRVSVGIYSAVLGATDNLIDRAVHGFTTDYIMFFRTSVLNLADILILFGALSVLVYYKNNPHRRRA